MIGLQLGAVVFQLCDALFLLQQFFPIRQLGVQQLQLFGEGGALLLDLHQLVAVLLLPGIEFTDLPGQRALLVGVVDQLF